MKGRSSFLLPDLFALAARLFVGGAFLWASWYKIIEPASFAKSIWYYHLVPGYLINLMALILPWLEMLVGLGLIFGIWYRGAMLWSLLMNLMFIVALSSAVMRGLNIECGCFKSGGGSGSAAAWKSLYLNAGMLAGNLLMLFAYYAARSRRWLAREE